jgi:hypothetical protein
MLIELKREEVNEIISTELVPELNISVRKKEMWTAE